jgi:hypothetical protein
MLRRHPDINAPTHELHFFSSNENFGRGVAWYHSQFDDQGDKVLYGEKTPEYLTVVPTGNARASEKTPARIHAYNPSMKLIVVLREPISRLRSAVNHMYRTRGIPPWVSAYDLVLGRSKVAAQAFSLLENGLYVDNLEHYYRLFPAHQISIFLFETDILQQPSLTLNRVCEFLGLRYNDAFFPDVARKKNEYQMSLPALTMNYFIPWLRPVNNRMNHIFPVFSAKIDARTLDFLQDYYRPYNERLRNLLGKLPENWVY